MRLLLVEDDVMVASGIKLGLSEAGYAVDWVGSGERAQEVLADQSSFTLEAATWDEFVALVDAPVRPDARLVELFARPQRITR